MRWWKENVGLGIYAFLFMVLPLLLTFCASDGKRERWQDCGGLHHAECQGDLGCEYELYKVCINE